MCNAELMRLFSSHFPNLKLEFISNNRFLLLQKNDKEIENQRFLKSEITLIDAFTKKADRKLKNYLKTIKNKAIY
jgi:hypothetical protein